MMLRFFFLVRKDWVIFIMNQSAEERVDLAVFSPACLPNIAESHVGLEGHVFGEQR